jgi:Tfp pilus assembly protein PilX
MSATRHRLADETGTALLLAIVLTIVLGAVAAVIALTARMEVLLSGAFHQASAALYAADGALSRALVDLSSASDWTSALAGVPSSFTHGDPQQRVDVGGGGSMLLCCGAGSLAAAVQHVANGNRTWGDNTPRWVLYGWGPASAWLEADAIRSPYYVAVWIADDVADGDGDPASDANDTVDLYAMALGPGGGRRAVRATAVRPLDPDGKPRFPGVRLMSWHESRW